MRRFFCAVALFVVLSGVMLPGATFAEPDAPATRLIVAFSDKNLTEAQARARLARHGARLERWLPELGLARVAVPVGAERAAAERLAADAGIRFATEDRRSVQIADTPLDEFWGQQWGPAKVGLPAAREITQGDPSVVIAVIDTGVNYNHWDLREQMWINPGESEVDALTGGRTCDRGIAQNGVDDDDNGYVDDCRGYNFDSGSNDPLDLHGHGTFVAGIAGAATNNVGSHTDGTYEGIAGMGGASRVMALRALDAGGFGAPFNIAEAIRYAADNGASVINLSLTLPVNYVPDDADLLCAATAYAQGLGALVVGASGNHSATSIQPVSIPAACPDVVAIGASTQTDTRAAFSDAGNRLDLLAPGEWIFSALRVSDTAYGIYGRTGSGTSFAAPHVSGAAALIRSLRPDFTQQRVRELLMRTADDLAEPGFDPLTGWGRLNVARAVEQAAVRSYLPVVGW